MSNDEAFWTLEGDTIPKVISIKCLLFIPRTHDAHNSEMRTMNKILGPVNFDTSFAYEDIFYETNVWAFEVLLIIYR